MKFNELYSFITTGESFHTWISEDGKLMYDSFLVPSGKYRLLPATNEQKDLEKFYSVFPSGSPIGDIDFIKERIMEYYKE